MKKGGRWVSPQGRECSPFASNRFLLQRVRQYWGPALGAPLSPLSRSPVSLPVLALVPPGWDCDADTEGYLFSGATKLSPPSQVFYTDEEQQKEGGDICLSKRNYPRACSGLLVLEGNSGEGDTSPPRQQPTNSHLR